ncbi:putative DDE superfamily endonuclease [Monocercomonoides exilis]|uniref:putative DDE superfamily endonuclease n=1 Tax=Monocercomonoides exilis TaxID=2049356 RepID=UPI00355A1BDA|nr:putative DDE superfamily endonuclease [Monocercomonoides exilis]|eukprot:MONOS_15965.1-p1 / transcript=MONOS_15965.1 / gene=MONOS_15965 / organism=Monocercomonoides_exilis_PA203 / gene_product=unspecified product / transcript_product=unspecified product / location=Mono_scaffold01431:319-1691(-) / protein_length=388 / sequence_SO=supercontig / SO=protein_coding / is_pseudo=false
MEKKPSLVRIKASSDMRSIGDEFVKALYAYDILQYSGREIKESGLISRGCLANELLCKKRSEGEEIKTVDKHWVDRFLLRHKKINLQKPKPLPIGRAAHSCKAVLIPFFDAYEKYCFKVKPIPQLMFNIDETSTVFSALSEEQVASSSSVPSSITPESSLPTSTSIILMTSADGCRYLAPILIPFKTIPAEYLLATTSTEVFIPTTSGHLTSSLFAELFKKIFLPEINKKRCAIGKQYDHAMLVMDGGVGHFSDEMKKVCRDSLIDLIKLPSHTSHILQPNDQFVFTSLKRNFSKATESGKATTAAERREAFIRTLKNGLSAASYPSTIIASWRICGLFPIEKNEVLNRLPDAPPQWAASQINPKRAPEGASYGAVYYSSDDGHQLFA